MKVSLLSYVSVSWSVNVFLFIKELKQITEGRVVALSHDITPDLLRTKPDPEVEQRQNQFEQRALQVTYLFLHKDTCIIIFHWSLVLYRSHQSHPKSKSMH